MTEEITVAYWRRQVEKYRHDAHTPLDSAVWAMRFASMLDKACDEIDERSAWPSEYTFVRVRPRPCAECPHDLDRHPPDGPCGDCSCTGWAPRCTCNYVAMPSMLTGRTTYVPGRRDPNCPTHPRGGAA